MKDFLEDLRNRWPFLVWLIGSVLVIIHFSRIKVYYNDAANLKYAFCILFALWFLYYSWHFYKGKNEKLLSRESYRSMFAYRVLAVLTIARLCLVAFAVIVFFNPEFNILTKYRDPFVWVRVISDSTLVKVDYTSKFQDFDKGDEVMIFCVAGLKNNNWSLAPDVNWLGEDLDCISKSGESIIMRTAVIQ